MVLISTHRLIGFAVGKLLVADWVLWPIDTLIIKRLPKKDGRLLNTVLIYGSSFHLNVFFTMMLFISLCCTTDKNKVLGNSWIKNLKETLRNEVRVQYLFSKYAQSVRVELAQEKYRQYKFFLIHI